MKNIALLFNTTQAVSGKAEPMARNIAETLAQRTITHTLFTINWPLAFDAFTEVWVVGGDGTLNYFINKYPDNQLPLVLFAGGSGNDFHWALYGNTKPAAQIEQILNGKIVEIDAGTCNGRLFLNGVGIGFDGAIAHDLLGKRKRSGKMSYLISILKNIAGYKEKSCSIQTDTTQQEYDCFMISVANGKRYGGGFMVAPKASIMDDLLEVVIIRKIPVWKRLRYLPVMEKGLHLELPFVNYQRTKQVVISAADQLPAHIDGEYISGQQFIIQLATKKIAFVV